MPVKIKVTCASKHEPDQLTIHESDLPAEVRTGLRSMPQHGMVILTVRPKGLKVDWHWAWQVNRVKPGQRTITTKTQFSSKRMKVPTTIGESAEIAVKSVTMMHNNGLITFYIY